MTIKHSQKVLIIAIVVLSVVLVLNIVFGNMLIDRIVSINDKVKQLDISSQEREKELNLKDSISNSKTEREKLGGYFVGAGNAETVEFTKYLEDLAKEKGVTQSKTLSYESVSGMNSSDAVSAIRYRFNVTGRWNNVYSFLQAIENLPKVSYLNSVSLNLVSEPVTAKDSRVVARIWSADLDFLVVKLK